MAQVVKEAESYLEQFMKLPDWNRYPMPETFYKTFNIEKPKALEIGALYKLALGRDRSSCVAPPKEESDRLSYHL